MQIIGVNVMDRKSPEALKEFLKNRPSPLTYTMAVDVDGKRTREKWLAPMDVNGIPHAFAVKNGKLIWRGHPVKLSEEIMQAMLKPDFSAASLPSENSDAGAREWKRYREVSKKLGEVVRKEGKQGAMAFFKANPGFKGISTGSDDSTEDDPVHRTSGKRRIPGSTVGT